MARGEKVVRALYQQHGAALMAYANRLTGGRRAWAEDVVTQTLVRAAKARDLGEGVQARLWLFRTVQDVVGEGTDSVVPAAQRRQLAVADALLALPPRHRDVLVAPKAGATATKDAFVALHAFKDALAARGVTKSGLDDLLAERQQ
ncbi:sigma factor [Kutzneria kofuensis]|uniref:DNA-directed RNA polymerase specialized sigma24 family protein n=1 Tax=Kutzneria kofuensis TaxID=103725 RepID=A0A7W9KBE5_9PSEU|nr:sigma factor [Kutzneria kofuensis]MBB5889345.1 DNA-directed RNA polymerase specialized sigma24 family protein [Kutzneria kofuensis]